MNQKMVLIPEMVLKLVKFEGFAEAYYEFCKTSATNADAYERVEELHEKYFGKRKYSCFQSFTVLMSRKIKCRKLS